MERLSFDEDHPYNAVEAAIHLARYALAAPYCRGARVLDIACGEGYGSRFLASLGAQEVVGVEIDHGAVARAVQRYNSPLVTFRQADAARVAEIFEADSFDLVVSLETIEHLREPDKFLHGLKSVARPGATLIISCPNDHWYFPNPADVNPYHLRKYTFDEFRQLSESILGTQCEWLLGGPVMGFGSMATSAEIFRSKENSQLRMNDYSCLDAAFAIPAQEDVQLEYSSCSYFVGIWGQPQRGSSVVYPLSMRAFEAAFYPSDCRQLSIINQQLEQRIAELEAELAGAGYQLQNIPRKVRALYARIRDRFSAKGQ